MPGVLAFDLAGRCGVAFGMPGEIPRATSIDLGKAGAQPDRLAKMLEATEAMVGRLTPDVLIYEAPIGGPRTSHFLVAIAGCFVGQARRMGYSPISASISSVRVHFLGRAPRVADFPGMTKAQAKIAIKAAVLVRCGALGWAPRGDDEADAMALFDFACAKYAGGQSSPLGDLFAAAPALAAPPLALEGLEV